MTLALTTLDHVKESFGITVNTYDAYISNLITRFSKLAENYIGRGDLTLQEYTEGYDGLGQLWLILRKWPVTEIASITIDAVELSADQYLLVSDGLNGLVRRKGSEFTGAISAPYGSMRWPTGGEPERIQVTYTAGYMYVPGDLEQAAIESVAIWYSRRLYGRDFVMEQLGSYQYQLASSITESVMGIPLPTEVVSILNSYKEIPI